MIYNILQFIDKFKPFKKASAHCDIPCKIYDPITSQISVLTMIRLVDLIEEIEKKGNLTINDHAQLSRLISQKEEHGHKVKDEIRVIWGDYIKQPQLEKFPELHDLAHSMIIPWDRKLGRTPLSLQRSLSELWNEGQAQSLGA